MKRIIIKSVTVLSLSFFLSASLFAGQADASWGAAKLAELLKNQGTTTVPQDPVPPAPAPDPAPSPAPVPAPNPGTIVGSSDLSQEEALLLKLVNEERQKNGLKPLQPMPQLNDLAEKKSKDIIEKNYFSHTSPTYGSFAKMVSDAGIRYYSVGENLAQARNATSAFYLFMGSSGHKANMLNPNFTHIGIGIVPYQYGVTVTQLFIMQ